MEIYSICQNFDSDFSGEAGAPPKVSNWSLQLLRSGQFQENVATIILYYTSIILLIFNTILYNIIIILIIWDLFPNIYLKHL